MISVRSAVVELQDRCASEQELREAALRPVGSPRSADRSSNDQKSARSSGRISPKKLLAKTSASFGPDRGRLRCGLRAGAVERNAAVCPHRAEILRKHARATWGGGL